MLVALPALTGSAIARLRSASRPSSPVIAAAVLAVAMLVVIIKEALVV